MNECPYCGSKLNGVVRWTSRRTDPTPGAKSTGVDLVGCPDCDRVIDGFSPH